MIVGARASRALWPAYSCTAVLVVEARYARPRSSISRLASKLDASRATRPRSPGPGPRRMYGSSFIGSFGSKSTCMSLITTFHTSIYNYTFNVSCATLPIP